jgi:hypothetical protein
MAEETYEESLKKLAGGAATGAKLGGLPGAVIGAGASAALPFVSKALGGLFGVDEASSAEKAATAELQRVASGGTTQAQAGMAYARARAIQDAERTGNRQQAMDVQARYASQLADLRSAEQERARSSYAFMEARRAAAEAQRQRSSLASAAEGSLGALAKFGIAAFSPDAAEQAAAQLTADNALKQALGIGAAPAAGGLSSAGAAEALGFTSAPAAAAAPVAAAAPAAVAAPAGVTAAGTSLADLDPSVAAALQTGTPGFEDVEQADPNSPSTYYGGVFGGPQRATNARGMAGVTASEQAAREAQNQATFDTLAGQRTGEVGMDGSSTLSKHIMADRGVPGTKSMYQKNKGAGSLLNIASTPETRAMDEQAAFNESIGAPQSTYYQSQSSTVSPFGLYSAKPVGENAEYRSSMNNTQMAQRDRMRSSMERQVGSLSPAKAPIASMPEPTSSGIRELQQTATAIGNPFGQEPEDVRLTGLRRTGKIIRGR